MFWVRFGSIKVKMACLFFRKKKERYITCHIFDIAGCIASCPDSEIVLEVLNLLVSDEVSHFRLANINNDIHFLTGFSSGH